MEVMLPNTSPDFNFDSACSSPHIPSTPKAFGGLYFSAPSSPTRASAFYEEFNNFSYINGGGSSSRGVSSNSSVIPYDWEEKPGTPKSKNSESVEENDDFAFDFSGQFSDTASVSADELFDGGKIKPLKPPPRLELGSRFSKEFGAQKSLVSSPKSPRSPIARIREVFSPTKKKDVDPFAFAIEQSSKGVELQRESRKGVEQQRERGRERVAIYSSSNASRKGSRSLSPYRTSGYEQQQQQSTKVTSSNTNPTSNSKTTSSSSSRKWSFRDFLLFRSASEGRASDRDPLRKFSLQAKRNEDVKNSSFRSTDNSGSGSGSMRKGRVSAHELHYKSNRAVAEEMKRKTVLPYKQGLFGWFRM